MEQELKVKLDVAIDLAEVEQLRQRLDLAVKVIHGAEILLTAHAQLLWEICSLDSRFMALYESHRAEVEEKLSRLAADGASESGVSAAGR